jgi:hypothetical protein
MILTASYHRLKGSFHISMDFASVAPISVILAVGVIGAMQNENQFHEKASLSK